MLPCRGAQLPDIQVPGSNSANEDASSVANNFFMYIFKVQPCPKRGAHDWSSCPYAHPKEKARRRDPRVYKYASTPCPESLKGMSCGRGVDCPFAHSVYEYWLHPTRFRTQMCKKGNQCNRTLCFFAHSACELRFPDTSDDLEAAAVDAAAASATAGALPLVTPGNQTITYHPSSMMVGAPSAAAAAAAANGSSSHGLPLLMGHGAQLANAANAGRYAGAGGSGSYGLVGMTGQQQQVQQMQHMQHLQQMQGLLVHDDSGASYLGLAGSDPNLHIPGIAMQQPQAAARSLSEPLPPMPDASPGVIGGCNSSGSAAWLQLAAASQLSASQIMSSIRPPTQQMQQAAQQLMPGAGSPGLDAALACMAAPPGMMGMGGARPAADNTAGADHLSSNIAAMGLADDSSTSSSCLTSVSGDHQYLAALNAAAAAAASGRPLGFGAVLQSPPKHSSNMENFRLLQQLQAQQQFSKHGSTASSMSCNLSPDSRQGSGNLYAAMPSMQNGSVLAGQQNNSSWGMRLA
ncbi:hypothetical protein COO60DRAFT_463560 [Scenedesmus sp. NREL 46B-D3]|nr:hypothetical protein COO60DRAFT_463560 [Scenedesmus sp. NREL 46B-D3]